MTNLTLLPNAATFVGHLIQSPSTPAISAVMFEYLLAGNGLFVRARRREYSVCLPVFRAPVRGLPGASGEIVWHIPKIPPELWVNILQNARDNSDSIQFREDVYAVCWDEAAYRWDWKNIGRRRRHSSAIADDTTPEYAGACLELHTHPPGAHHFSRADDRDEGGKFRIFGILVDIHSPQPKIRFRCGIYDHFVELAADHISELPADFLDLNRLEQSIREHGDET